MAFFPSPLTRMASDALAERCQLFIKEHGWGFWAAELKDAKEFIGFVGLHTPSAELPFAPCVEIGWRLARQYWGKGFATEAATESLRIGFEVLGLQEIVSFTAPGNHRSRAVMERLGMRESGTFEYLQVPENSHLRRLCLYRLSTTSRQNMNPITLAQINDAEAILGLQKRAYESEARLYNDWRIPPLTQSLDSLKSDILAGGVLKYSRGGAIIGSVRASLRDGKCEIGRLIVEPAFQGQGIGSALLAAIEAKFPQADRFELFTGSRSEGNIHLYQRHGYAITAIQALSPAVTLVFMAKPQKRLPDDSLLA
jgi:RimJ/RimL family protein N-acetyltransferase